MAKDFVAAKHRKKLEQFLKKNKKADLVSTYIYYVECLFDLKPVVFPVGKTIYRDTDHAIACLEKTGDLWREADIKITFDQASVNEETKRIYICPHTGKVFGDNTHPNPQDAIYDWVSKCPENTERVGGLRSKRFLVSEDPEVIKNYITERTKSITKRVYSSCISGKLFNSRESIIEDFKKNYLKFITLVDAQNQNRFQIHEELMNLLQEQLQEDKISAFIECLSEHEFFKPYVILWLEAQEEALDEEETEDESEEAEDEEAFEEDESETEEPSDDERFASIQADSEEGELEHNA